MINGHMDEMCFYCALSENDLVNLYRLAFFKISPSDPLLISSRVLFLLYHERKIL